MTSRHDSGVPRLLIRNFVPADGHYHVARHLRSLGRSGGEHTHDFAEVFWIESGAAVHVVNGQSQEARAGDLVLMRPADRHGFRAPSAEGYGPSFALVNVAFRREHLLHLRRRYYRRAVFPWQGDALPGHFRVAARQLRRLAELADGLALGPQTLLRLEHFLLELLEIIETAVRGTGDAGAATESPHWLRAALAEFGQPEHLSGGVRELARLAGRGPEHLNRVVRRCMGFTTTELVNRLRLEHAARELSMTVHPIPQIALESGFENLSYFYRLFARRYGRTPRRFRRHSQMLVR
jgi:AraC family cel operon transcriptional repressor